MSPKEAHNTAVTSFNQNHASYDVFRPSFTPLLVNPFLVDLGLAEKIDAGNGDGDGFKFFTEKKIVEIASGTGKFTKNLVENGWSENLTVVEPSSGMLQTFRKNFPEIKTIQASSYRTPLEDNSVDAVIIAQGFHWFADDDSLKEINRILKPSGKLGMIWNFDHLSSSQDAPAEKSQFYNAGSRYFDSLTFKGNNLDVLTEFFANQKWNEEATKYVWSLDVNVPQYRHGKWRKVLLTSPYFKHDILDSFALYDQEKSKDDVWKYWETRSYVTDLQDDKKEEIKEHLASLIEKYATDESYTDADKNLLIKPIGIHCVVVSVNK
ncbi:uncharacterized protein LODBEIA_P26330 [Lodderomyces beijingensis]|uniref:Methyltransferase type 11 domain-containing protein n=1 Tax=Lodderomyces beijingensis TaxID=1775926 RepID=A0ABP0ZJT8_9ASCO